MAILNAIGLAITLISRAWALGRGIFGYVRDTKKAKPFPQKPTPALPDELKQKLTLNLEAVKFPEKYPKLKEFYIEAAHEAVRICNTVEFRDAIYRADFTETNGDTNEEVYKRIMGGADKANEIDFALNIYVSSYYEDNSVLGYTYTSTYRTWVNRRYLRDLVKDSEKRPENAEDNRRHAAGHIIHEYCHNIGYGHRRKKSTSVPYVVGRIIRRLDV